MLRQKRGKLVQFFERRKVVFFSFSLHFEIPTFLPLSSLLIHVPLLHAVFVLRFFRDIFGFVAGKLESACSR